MKDLWLIGLMIGVFVLGYFFMGRIDKLLEENRKAIAKREEVKEPSFIMLKAEMSDEEIEDEIERFRKKHSKTKIFLYDSEEIELPEPINNDNN